MCDGNFFLASEVTRHLERIVYYGIFVSGQLYGNEIQYYNNDYAIDRRDKC